MFTRRHLLLVFGGVNGLEAVLRDSQADIPAAIARTAVRQCLNGELEGHQSDLRKACRSLVRQGEAGGLLEAFVAGECTEIPPACLFDAFVNTCPLQTSRTIRAEEALLVTLSAMRQAGIHSRQEENGTSTTMVKKRRLHLPPLLRVIEAIESADAEQET